MKYTNVYIESFGYELPPVVVTTQELEERLAPLYEKLHISPGQLEYITGIAERRWWQPGQSLSLAAAAAGRKALAAADMKPQDMEALVYGSVNREHFEPATACHVAAALGIGGKVWVYDVSNACLGALNGMVDIANRIQLGEIRAGMVVACETAREINDIMIERMLEASGMETFALGLATLTGGSAAVAVILSDGSFPASQKCRRLLGGTALAAPQYHDMCLWGLKPVLGAEGAAPGEAGLRHHVVPFTRTDSASMLKYGLELGVQTWEAFRARMGWTAETIDKVICHQVGKAHQETILKMLGVDLAKDFPTYPFLGNTGSVALPISFAIAEDRDFLKPGDHVALLGIGSGLNCVMLGVEW